MARSPHWIQARSSDAPVRRLSPAGPAARPPRSAAGPGEEQRSPEATSLRERARPSDFPAPAATAPGAQFWAPEAVSWHERRVNRESIPVLGPEPGGDLAAPSRALDGLCAALSWAVPLGVALWSLSGEAGFRDDLGILRDLGFVRVDSEGLVSTLLTQVLALLPLGGRALRASLLGVLALGLASRCLYGCVCAALDRRGAGTSHPFLALLASSLWALGPAVQSEATRVGGALPAVALVSLGLGLGSIAFARAEAVSLAAAGLAFGATLAESRAAGAWLALALAMLAVLEPKRRWRGSAWRLLGAAAAAYLLLGSLRWFWPATALTLPLDAASPRSPMLGEPPTIGFVEIVAQTAALIRAEVGGVALVLGLAGAGVAAGLAPLRRVAAAWALPAAFAALGPAVLGLHAGAAPVFGLLASRGLLAFSPIALQALVSWAWRSPLPLARPAAVLSLTFASTLALSRLDRALLERPPERAAVAWADEALGRLPANGALLVQSAALALRLLASRTLHGTRPDVIVIPAALLGTSSFGPDLQRAARSAAPLLRQLWVNGVADEYSLSRLADERPVFVELDARWDRRLLEHLRPDGLWLAYSAASLSGADRRAASSSSRAALRRILAGAGVDVLVNPAQLAVDEVVAIDPDTRRALGDGLAQQALSFAALAEHDSARRLLKAAQRIDPDNPLAAALGLRLAAPVRGRVAAFDLLE
jgi:hypothetical protein